jgi:hypothetical protein
MKSLSPVRQFQMLVEAASKVHQARVEEEQVRAGLGLVLSGLVGIAIVATGAYTLARPLPGIGIALPAFIPPVIAAGVGMLLALEHAPALAARWAV